MKKIFSLFLCLALLMVSTNFAFANESELLNSDKLSPIAVEAVTYNSNKNLTAAQISERFQTINTTYEIGQPFSEEDVEFIRAYANPTNQNQDNAMMRATIDTIPIDNLANANNVYGRIYGNVYLTVDGLSRSFGGNLTGTAASSTQNITNLIIYVEHTAFGIIGSGGVGIVYNKTLSASSASTPVKFNKSQPYSAAVMYSSTYCWLDVVYSNGTLSVPGN